MSHVPFVAINSNDAFFERPALDADDLRTSSDLTASSISPTTNLANKMAATNMSQRNRLPTWLAFPMSVIISFGLSASLYSFVPDVAGYELATVSRSLNEPWQIGALLAWKAAEIGFAWSAGLDYFDLLNLSILANIPYYVLLRVFYSTSFLALCLGFSIDIFSLTVPFYLLRRVNFYNARNTTSSPTTVSELAVDRSIQFWMSLFAAAVYSLIVYSSFFTWLPVYLVVHFDEVRSLEAAHNAALPILFAACVPIGYAAKNFLFKPSIAAAQTPTFVFDPRTATLKETFSYNLGLGAHSSRGSILTSRTVLLTWFSFVNTFVRVFGTVEGTDAFGTAGWAGLWSVAALAVGVGFAWVGES